ncbi:MAG: PHP domain-containing protein [Planctomycetaceae bacterium]|nr:PHP domain-containing protein [Planctomycetaceae bacterium]
MTRSPKFRVDLHSHTTRSDGNDTPAEFLDQAAALGVAVAAITDHDVLPPDFLEVRGDRIPVGQYAQTAGIGVLRGMEVSCDTDVDDVHIIGFGCRWDSEYLAWLPETARQSKINGYRRFVERLRDNGFDFTWEELTKNGLQPDEAVQKKHVFELLAEKGYTESWQAAKIMIRDNPDYDVKREKPCPMATIRSFHAAGGVAILAHPYLIDETVKREGEIVSRDRYIRRLIDAGLDGMETHYPYDKTSYKGVMTPDAISREVIDRYGDMVSILSGGSDYHADHKKGVANPRMIGDAGIELEYFLNHPLLPSYCEGVDVSKFG